MLTGRRELASYGFASQVQAGCSSWQTCVQHAAGSCQARLSGHELEAEPCTAQATKSHLHVLCKLHPAQCMQPAGHLCTCCAGVDWRQKLDAQRGAVLATELKNNANKLARWTAAAMISGTELIKLGYISRHHPRENRHHTILGTQVGIGGGLGRVHIPHRAPHHSLQTDEDSAHLSAWCTEGTAHGRQCWRNTPAACKHVLPLCVDSAVPYCLEASAQL